MVCGVLGEERSNRFRIFLQPCLRVVTNPPVYGGPSVTHVETPPQRRIAGISLMEETPRRARGYLNLLGPSFSSRFGTLIGPPPPLFAGLCPIGTACFD